MTSAQYKDVAERSLWTGLQAFAGVIAGLSITGSIAWSEVLYSALIAGAIAVCKGFVGLHVGEKGKASLP